jgi:hypothetical protein
MQLVVYILLSTLMTAVAFAAPFHHDLGELTGIGAPRIDSLMILLSALSCIGSVGVDPQKKALAGNVTPACHLKGNLLRDLVKLVLVIDDVLAKVG